MKLKWIALTLTLALGTVLVVAVVVCQAQAAPLFAGDLKVEEMGLSEDGAAYEVNTDSQGSLWISDYDAGEIWQIDPAREVYTIYHGLLSPSDARRDAAGAMWWGEGESNRLGRLWPASGEATFWEMPGASALYGTEVDAAGRAWVIDFADPDFYRLDPSINEVCTYTLPLDGTSNYLTMLGGDLWLGDWANDRIYRLDVGTSQFTYWQVPSDISPEKMAFDSEGRLWWADWLLGELATLNPGADQLTRYAPPATSSPAFVAPSEVGVWYTDWERRIGLLDPQQATGVTTQIDAQLAPASPACDELAPADTMVVTNTTGVMSWTTNTYPAAMDEGGWAAFALPVDGGVPWGIAISQGYAWFVDTGRRVLGRTSLEPWGSHRVFLPIALRH